MIQGQTLSAMADKDEKATKPKKKWENPVSKLDPFTKGILYDVLKVAVSIGEKVLDRWATREGLVREEGGLINDIMDTSKKVPGYGKAPEKQEDDDDAEDTSDAIPN